MKKSLNILVTCEESQEVTKAFRALGHTAFSCDLLPCSGGHPEWHLQMDALSAMNRNAYISKHGIYEFDGPAWDLVIAHPPCTRLANSGVRWLASREPRSGYTWSEQRKLYMRDDPKIWADLIEACSFFNSFINYAIKGGVIAIENPIMHRYAKEPIPQGPSQIIQPWQFGHGESKATCLWLFGLPKLVPTDIVAGRDQRVWKMTPSADRAKLRSKTYPGIAKAMAEQWSEYIINQKNA